MIPPAKSYSRVRYRIDGKFKKFRALVALNDAIIGKYALSPVTFSVRGDDRELWKSKPIKFAGRVQECTVDVSGVKMLELRARVKGSPLHAAAVWLDPYLGG